MIKSKSKKLLSFININDNFGFGLVDAIVSLSLLFGVITYGIYFSSLRLRTVYDTNLTTSINKEIERDIERLKSDFWGMYFEESETCKGEYCLANGDPLSSTYCEDFTQDIVNLTSWNIQGKSSNINDVAWIISTATIGSHKSILFLLNTFIICFTMNPRKHLPSFSEYAIISDI